MTTQQFSLAAPGTPTGWVALMTAFPDEPARSEHDLPLLLNAHKSHQIFSPILIGTLIACLLIRLLAMAQIPLIPEEAYYWMYAQNPNLSYFDHPPMVAWVIGLGTWLFENTEFGVRIMGNLLMVGASLLMYRFGRAWYGRTAALWSAILLQVLPLYYGIGFIATMDSPLLLFWMLGLVAFTEALRSERRWAWYLAGAAMGGAMLSKYTGVFLGVGMLLALALHRPWRRYLLTPHPYLAAALAFAVFSPVIIWNAEHGWSSFKFQFLDRFGEKPISLRTMGLFVALQLVVLTPVLVAGLCASLIRVVRSRRLLRTPQSVLSLSFSAPLLMVFAYKSLRHEIHINWMAPLFLALLPAICQMILAEARSARKRMGRRVGAPRGLMATVLICMGLNAAVLLFLLTIQPRLQMLKAFGPWRQLAAAVEDCEDRVEIADGGQEPLVIANGRYRFASVMAFYRTPIEHDEEASDFTTSEWILEGPGLGFEYWMDRTKWVGKTCIMIDDDQDALRDVAGWFDDVEVVEDPRLDVGVGYQMLVCRGLRESRGQEPAAIP